MKKFIEIEGIKYQVDPEDETKALVDDKGEKVLYEEPVDPEPPKDDKPVEPPKSDDSDDPEKLKMQEEIDRLNRENDERETKAKQDKADALEKQGEYKKLYTESKAELDKVRGELAKAKELGEKDKALLKELLSQMMSQIQPEKQSLVPQGSGYREGIKYIMVNHKHLGVSLVTKGGKVPKNDETPTDEQKLVDDKKRFQELHEKAKTGTGLTPQEQREMSELSRKI